MAEENQDPDWKKLEKVIADIQRVLAPDAVVQHDERVIGRSGALRKLDVSIRYSLGADPILIVVDCKHHSKDAVDRKEVAGFAEQLEDVRASLGIMVSISGYDSGARYLADKNAIRIILKTYREAEQTDWENLVGQGAWFNFNHLHFDLRSVRMVLVDGRKLMGVPPGLILYKSDGSFYQESEGRLHTFFDLFVDAWNQSPRPREVGLNIYLEFDQIQPPLWVPSDAGKLDQVDVVILEGSVVPKRYVANIQIAAGRVLAESESDNAEYIKAHTERVNLTEIISTQEGIEYTMEEWIQSEREEQRLDLLKVKKDDSIEIHLAGVRKDLLKKVT